MKKFIESPTELWCGQRGVKQVDSKGQFNPRWRPFTGPLSINSQKIAIATLNSMMNFLVSANYLASNPLLLDKKHRQQLSKKSKTESYHALSE